MALHLGLRRRLRRFRRKAARRIRRQVTRRFRRSVMAVRTAWSHKLKTVFAVLGAVPAPVRRAVAGPIARFAELILRRRPRLRGGPEFAFIMRWTAGPDDAAAELARRLGTSPRTARHTRGELARLAMNCGYRAVVVDILASIPEDRAADLEGLRASLDLEQGRYTEALIHARTSLKAGRRAAQRPVDMISSRLAVLEEGWTPDLGPDARALERVRGKLTPGRVLFVVSTSLPYRQAGYTLRSQSIALCQKGVGIDPHFATRGSFPANMGIRGAPLEQRVGGVPYHRLAPDFAGEGFHDRLLSVSAQAAVPLIERLRPALLHATSNHMQSQIAHAVAGPAGIPVVYEVRGFLEETWASHPRHDEEAARRTDRYRLNRAAETRAMLAADAVVTLSETMREEIISRGCAPDRVVVVPNAVDVDRFRPIPRSDELAASLGIEPGVPVVGYISSFTRYEGMHFLLEAAARLRAAGRRVHVLLVGDGAEEATLVAAGRRLGLDDGTLIMPGRVPHDDVLRYYSIIDVFVVPRTNDRVSQLVTPLKPYEAMSLELALVVSDVPALREMVIPGETGLTFRPEDDADLADVLSGLLDDPELRRRLGRRAREWVAASRTWDQNGQLYRDLYERLGVV
jgi:glycosyltransferase involved in cell wall biosynthesis